MKTVLAATDFTPSSFNACLYAGMLAKKLECKLVVFNLFEVPVVHSNSGLYFVSYSAAKERSEEKLIKTVKELKSVYPKIKIEAFTVSGAFQQQIESFLKEHHVEAVVLGLAAKNQLSKFIYGSHSTDIAGKVNAPVIIIPEQYKSHHLKTILLGVDNTDKLANVPLRQFTNIISGMHAKVKLLHVRTKNELFQPTKTEFKLIDKTQRIDTFFAKDVADGLNKFSTKGEFDLLAVISRNHSGFYDLFSESTTKKIAFVSKIPVMSIHE